MSPTTIFQFSSSHLMETAELPTDFKSLRACLRCSLVKNFSQFHDTGCDNCEFLNFSGDTKRIHECTTPYFEGTIALLEPQSSWVAKWQRLESFVPGVYAIEVIGNLPDDALEQCDNLGLETRASVKANKA